MTDIKAIFDTTKTYEFFLKDQPSFIGKISGITEFDDDRVITAIDENGAEHSVKYSVLDYWVAQK